MQNENSVKKDATPIKEVAKDVIRQLSKERLLKEDRINRIWQKAAGKKFYPHTQPVSFRRKRLVVNVDSSGWLYELTMNREKITAKLGRMLKEEFKELRLRIGKIER